MAIFVHQEFILKFDYTLNILLIKGHKDCENSKEKLMLIRPLMVYLFFIIYLLGPN